VQNATITIERNPIEYDDETGNRKVKDNPETIVDDAPCFFFPSRASRRAFAGTLRDSVKMVPALTYDDPGELSIKVGDMAFVTWQGVTTEYKIGHAFISQGIAFRKWYIELEAIDVPVA
jgi:hypothetical protein